MSERVKLKSCSTCKELKPYSDFGANRKTKTGRQSACRKCCAAYHRNRYANDPELRERIRVRRAQNAQRTRNYMREYCARNRERTKERSQEYLRSLSPERARDIRSRAQAKYRSKFPYRDRARSRVRHALKTGQLLKEPCKICGDTKAQAHHSDYGKPLDVMWLCSDHHSAWHRVFEPTPHPDALDGEFCNSRLVKDVDL